MFIVLLAILALNFISGRALSLRRNSDVGSLLCAFCRPAGFGGASRDVVQTTSFKVISFD